MKSMDEKNIRIISHKEIDESSNYFEAKADSVISIGTSLDGDEIITLIFLNNSPVITHDGDMLTVCGLEKKKVASITMGKNQTKKFYEALKKLYEDD